MSEIDVNGCYADKKELKDGMYCFWEGKSCKQVNDCYYKQLQQLKAENEELKKQIKSCKECAEQLGKHKVAEQCLDEIEGVCNSCRENAYCFDCEYDNYCQSELQDYILQLIKQAKEN